jgi:iron complex transport system ATP-binding protein
MRLLHHISREAGKVIFLSTHDLDLALQLADTVWLMDREHGVSIGTPEDLALNGTLPAFYSRRGIVFDETAGVFRVDCETIGHVRLTGVEGPRLHMAAKALRRYGFDVTDDDKAFCRVEVTDKGFAVSCAKEQRESATVGELVREVTRLWQDCQAHCS